MIQNFKKSGAKIRVLFESGGGNICFFWYTFLVLGVSFVGNATPNLYSLTFFGLSSSQIFSRCPLVLCMWLKYGLKAQKLLAQGIALGIKAISKSPCKGKSFMFCVEFKSFCPYRATGLRP